MSMDTLRRRLGRLRRWSIAVPLVAAAGLAAAGCGGAGGAGGSTADAPSTSARQPAGTVGGTLRFAAVAAPSTINPALGSTGVLGLFLQVAYEPLLWLEPDGTLSPGLATSWSWVGSGNTKLRLRIRDGAGFSDGSPVTAQAVARSIDYYRKAKGPFAGSLGAVEDVTANGSTVTIALGAPNPDLPLLLTQSWTAGDIVGPEGLRDPDGLAGMTDGAGQYMLDPDATTPGNTYAYVQNPHYYDKSAVHWKRIELKVYKDANSALQALETGQVDVMYGDPSTASDAAGRGFDAIDSPSGWTGLILADRAGDLVPALGSLEVRQALNYGIDRDAIAKALYGEYATPTAQIVGPGWPGYDAAYDERYPYDPGKAKRMLASAGYPDGFSMTLLTVQTNQRIAQAIAGELKKIGVDVKIKSDATIAEWAADMATKQYPTSVSLFTFVGPYIGYALLLGENATTWNWQQSSDAQMRSAADTAAAADGAEAMGAWQALYRRVADLAWFLPVVRTNGVYIASDDVSMEEPGQANFINPVLVRPAQPADDGN